MQAGSIMAAADSSHQVDVVILSMERAPDTIEAIASSLEQEGVSKHVWVVDQGSSRESVAALQVFVADKPQVTLKLLDRNLGVPGGRNVGIGLGTSPYIVSLDNDATFSDRGTLARAVEYLDADPTIAAIGFRIFNYYSGGDDDSSWRYPKALQNSYDREFLTTRFPGGGHAIRRDAFERAGRYDDSLFFNWEEMDLCFRLINLGYQIKYVPGISIRHKTSPVKRTSWKNDRYYYLVRNGLYVRFKYGIPLSQISIIAGGYILKGFINGVAGQAFRAVRDAVRMSARFARRRRDAPLFHLSASAKRYIFDNDLRHRGGFWQRVRREVFAKLPGSAAPGRRTG